MTRPTPYELALGRLGPQRFPVLRAALSAARIDERHQDAFMLAKGVVELLRELRPDEGAGGAIDELAAFLHAAYLFWLDGQSTVEVGDDALESLLRGPASAPAPAPGPSYYLQLPMVRVWGEPIAGRPPEPLDGCFVRVTADGVDLLAVFGLHPGRPGFTAVRAMGHRPPRLDRADGTPAFAPRLEGGEAAGLFSLAGAEELVELVCRCHGAIRGEVPRPADRNGAA
jgi:hypothetical protein